MENQLPIRVIVGLLDLTKEQKWLLPALVALALIAFMFEGLAIYLLMPLLYTLFADRTAMAVEGQGSLINAIQSLTPDMETQERAAWLVGAIVVCVLIKGVTALASQSAFAYGSAEIGHNLRRRIFGNIVTADQHLINSRTPGALLNTLATESWRISQGLQVFAAMITHVCAILIFLGLMIAVSWRMTAIVVLAVCGILALIHAVTIRARRFGELAVQANRALAERIVESLGGLRIIQLFGQENYEACRFRTASAKVKDAFFRMDVLGATPTPLLEFLFALLIGGLLLSVEPEGLFSVLVLLALLQRMQPHASGLVNARVSLMGLGGALDDVRAILDEPDARPLPNGDLPAPRPQRAIQFQNVQFRYPRSPAPALDRVNFEIPAGRTTALVGESGAGKSTILSLLCRLVDPDNGQVLVDGLDLRTFDLTSWRERIAVVPQDVYLFSASVRENIVYGRPEATRFEIEDAAQTAKAHQFIVNLQDGYDTRIGEGGVRLSGGQRQRIALARALLRDPDLLILDEATNALDSLSERMVQDALSEASAGRTILIVAHRMASIRNANYIIVLDKGKVIEQGTPDYLRQSDGKFSKILEADIFS